MIDAAETGPRGRPPGRLLLALFSLLGADCTCGERTAAEYTAVSPPLISNQSAYSLILYGTHLEGDLRLIVKGRRDAREVTTYPIDARHRTALLPPMIIDARQAHEEFDSFLVDERGRRTASVRFTIVNDAAFPDFRDLAVKDGRAYVISTTSDDLWVHASTATPTRVPVADRPVAVAAARDGIWVLHRGGALWQLEAAPPHRPKKRFMVPREGNGLAIQGDRGYVTSNWTERLHVFELGFGRELFDVEMGVDPGPVAVSGSDWIVANQSSDDLTLGARRSARARVQTERGTPIYGGPTESFSDLVMGGKAGRALVIDAGRNVAFVSSIGPNVGPNPSRMEVSMNGGIGVVDLEKGRFLHHVALARGLPSGLALDAERGLLFATDFSTGRVVVFARDALIAGGPEARELGDLKLLPNPGGELTRPAGDFASEGRVGPELHSGPFALRLEGSLLYVLERFTGQVDVIDVSGAHEGQLRLLERRPSAGVGRQSERRLGQIVYYTDLGNTRMSCDACHPDGHNDGVLFTKTAPLHIYRAPSLRSIRLSPPYFTPGLLPSLQRTSEMVLARNRYHSPDPTEHEIRTLSLFQRTLVAPPNPNWEGSWPERIALPDGREGRPAVGLALFEQRGCAGCHPPPAFTHDFFGGPAKLYDIGTPITLPLRPTQQDGQRYKLPAPALIGAWDIFPLLHSGAAGFSVVGDQVLATHRFPLRRVLEYPEHGAELTIEERDDLLAFVLCL